MGKDEGSRPWLQTCAPLGHGSMRPSPDLCTTGAREHASLATRARSGTGVARQTCARSGQRVPAALSVRVRA